MGRKNFLPSLCPLEEGGKSLTSDFSLRSAQPVEVRNEMLRRVAYLAACAVIVVGSASAASVGAAPALRNTGRQAVGPAFDNEEGEIMYERTIIHRLNDSKEGKSAAIEDAFDKARSVYERLEIVLNDGDDNHGDPDACGPHGGDHGKRVVRRV